MKYKNKTVFIVSSSMFPLYSLAFKDTMNEMLKGFWLDYINCVVWSDEGVFKPGYGFLETLHEMTPDYVVALATPDDTAVIRGKEYIIPRDNVIFEYGLFLGRLGRDRTFFVTPENTPDLQILSDLHGVTTVRYRFSPYADFSEIKKELLSAVWDISRYISQMESNDIEPQEVADMSSINPKVTDLKSTDSKDTDLKITNLKRPSKKKILF